MCMFVIFNTCLKLLYSDVKFSNVLWLNIIILNNLYNLKTFLIKISIIILILRNLKIIKYYNFVNLLIIIMMFVYSLLFNRLITKSIKISYHYHIKIDINHNISCFYL